MTDQSFSDIAITVAEKLRLCDDVTNELVADLLSQLKNICDKYERKDYIPKSLAFDLLSLHDALEGSLNYYSGDKKEYISKINSDVSYFIERLLLA